MSNEKPQTNKVVTGKVRLSYAHLFTPKANEDGKDPKYSVSILIPKSDTETLRKIKAAVEAVKKDPASVQKWGGKLPPNLKTPLRDGDVEKPDHPEYAGHYFFNASSKQKPGIVDRNLQPILDQTEVYSGCYARVSVNFFAYNTSGNKGIGAGLNHVQKWADGEPLSGRSRAEDDFADAFSEEDNFLA